MTALGMHCGYRCYRFCFPLDKFYGHLSPWKGKRSLYYPCILYSEGSSTTFFVRSFRSFAVTYISCNLTFPTLTVSLFTECEGSFSMLHKQESIDESYLLLTFEEQRKRKSTINILQFYHLFASYQGIERPKSKSREFIPLENI